MSKTTILIESATRKLLKRVGRKEQSYDDLLKELELPHDCHLSPYFRSKNGRIRARAEKMEALSKIDEYARRDGVEV